MADWVSDGPISVPLHIKDLRPDVDLGGLKFSYDQGFFYDVQTEYKPLRMPDQP